MTISQGSCQEHHIDTGVTASDPGRALVMATYHCFMDLDLLRSWVPGTTKGNFWTHVSFALIINSILNIKVEISFHSWLTESLLKVKLNKTYFCPWPDHQSTSNMATTTSLLSDQVACLWSIYLKLFHHRGQLITWGRRYLYSSLKLWSCLQSKIWYYSFVC